MHAYYTTDRGIRYCERVLSVRSILATIVNVEAIRAEKTIDQMFFKY